MTDLEVADVLNAEMYLDRSDWTPVRLDDGTREVISVDPNRFGFALTFAHGIATGIKHCQESRAATPVTQSESTTAKNELSERVKTVGELLDIHDKLTEIMESLDWLLGTIHDRGDLSGWVKSGTETLKRNLAFEQDEIVTNVIAALEAQADGQAISPTPIIHNGFLYERQEQEIEVLHLGRHPESRACFRKSPIKTATDVPVKYAGDW